MSIDAIQTVLDHSQTTGPDRAIMLILAFHKNHKMEFSYPSLPRIAKESGLSRRTVCRRLRYLVKIGELSIQHGGQSVHTHGGKQVSNRYTLTLKGGVTQSPPYSKGVTESPKGGVSQTPKGVSHSPKGGVTVSPELKENRNTKPKPNQKPEKPGGGVVFCKGVI